MTAEIAVLNRQAIALAADSAVTVDAEPQAKIWQSANKIFRLSHHHSVGVMIYGSADFMRMPWDTIITLYRDQLGSTPFPLLNDYRDDLLRFLKTSHTLFPAAEQERFFRVMVGSSFYRLRKKVEDRAGQVIAEHGAITTQEIADLLSEEIVAYQEGLEKRQKLPHLPDSFRQATIKKYSGIIEEVRATIFQKMPLSAGASRRLRTISGLMFERDIFSPNASGLVIAGFGQDEYFPGLISLTFEGVVNGELNYIEGDSGNGLTRDNNARVRAFAQSDVTYAFMEGIDADYQDVLESAMHQIFYQYPPVVLDGIDGISDVQKKRLKDEFESAADVSFPRFVETMADVRRDYHWQPIVEVVSVLPKDELAAMAETLVSLTSFRRRVSLQLETVGGPVDVAVISKGDGFVWVKRKNYFPIEQNQHFVAR